MSFSYEVYDTYDKKTDSDDLYKALVAIPQRSIVMLATHDEASNKLSENVKGILFRFGSSAVARMKYRYSIHLQIQSDLGTFTPFIPNVSPVSTLLVLLYETELQMLQQ